jgi:hypothetical protein
MVSKKNTRVNMKNIRKIMLSIMFLFRLLPRLVFIYCIYNLSKPFKGSHWITGPKFKMILSFKSFQILKIYFGIQVRKNQKIKKLKKFEKKQKK